MKRISILGLFALLAFSACQKNDEPPVPSGENVLNYDGPNATGPLLAAGEYEAAARFPAVETNPYEGKRLTEVTWFMGILPSSCKVRIYGPGSGDEPGQLLYSADVTDRVQVPSWNTHELRDPILIEGQELWISIAFTHPAQQQSIGCDSGPNVAGGDWLFSSNDNQWITYVQRTGESVNWNIRGIVGE
ncbi:MAG: hypothetical protein H6557_28025 [Lewinellaceae bacterium]|nr:hypothetical protein [Phaeodactylibacter sp.]MCB9040492.1 hypothetical protein [Lewinellaceae bacterium]